MEGNSYLSEVRRGGNPDRTELTDSAESHRKAGACASNSGMEGNTLEGRMEGNTLEGNRQMGPVARVRDSEGPRRAGVETDRLPLFPCSLCGCHETDTKGLDPDGARHSRRGDHGRAGQSSCQAENGRRHLTVFL